MLQGALHDDERPKELARTPLTLALCILTHAERQRLPADRAVVLRCLADCYWTAGVIAGDRVCGVPISGWHCWSRWQPPADQLLALPPRLSDRDRAAA